MRAELLSLLLILAESATKSHRSRSRSRTGSPFLDQELNNTIVLVTTGEDLTLNCRVDRLQVILVKIEDQSSLYPEENDLKPSATFNNFSHRT